MKSSFCIVEDRPAWEPSLKLLLLSLSAYASGGAINLFYPPAGRTFLGWAEGLPHVRVRTQRLRLSGWDVKPEAALVLIDEGFDEVIWIDSDIVACRDPNGPFRGLSPETFALTIDAEAAQRNGTAAARARSWGLEVRRELPFNPNLGVFRATRCHCQLLARWSEMLARDEYQACQRMEWKERPLHMMGDHDPLAALLCSAEFSEIPVQFLRRGADIIHFDGVYGYTSAARIQHFLFGPPVFVHSMGAKPWSHRWNEPPLGLRDWFKERYFDVSPYTAYAAKLGQEFGFHEGWMDPHYPFSRALRALGMGRPPLIGLPLAVLADIARLVSIAEGR